MQQYIEFLLNTADKYIGTKPEHIELLINIEKETGVNTYPRLLNYDDSIKELKILFDNINKQPFDKYENKIILKKFIEKCREVIIMKYATGFTATSFVLENLFLITTGNKKEDFDINVENSKGKK